MEDDKLKIIKQLTRRQLLSPPTLRDHTRFLLICDKRTQSGQRGGLHWTLLDNTGVIMCFLHYRLFSFSCKPVKDHQVSKWCITLTRRTSDLAVPLAELTLRYECVWVQLVPCCWPISSLIGLIRCYVLFTDTQTRLIKFTLTVKDTNWILIFTSH